ncbi:MAG TPA: M48 family peptidase [Thermoplasmatales archaeon]|nr:M48 family peptidase [Thermoplasmatales archaeon]
MMENIKAVYHNVEVIRSTRRKKTVQAKEVKGKIFVYLPAYMDKEKEQKYIKEIIKKMEEKKRREKLNNNNLLTKRAQQLNKKYFDGKLRFEIKYVTNQNHRFGSCSPKNKRIRISDRVADMPQWVRDYVIIHELAHLIQPNHSKKFWQLVNRYKYTERAKGYLIAVGMGVDEKIDDKEED